MFRFLQLKVSMLMGTSLWCRWGIYRATLTPQTLQLSSVTCQVCSINSAVVILWSTCSTTASWHRESVISDVTTYFPLLWFYNYLSPSNKWFADILHSDNVLFWSQPPLPAHLLQYRWKTTMALSWAHSVWCFTMWVISVDHKIKYILKYGCVKQ